MKYMKKIFIGFITLLLLPGCAALYHVQISDIETTDRGRIIDIKLSEMGVDIKGAGHTATAVARNKHISRGNQDAANATAAIDMLLALINFGPSTGFPVFTDRYADQVLDEIVGRCPSGKITGLTSIREARDYTYISGEIVNIRGYCID